MSTAPTLKTFEEFCEYYEKGSEDNKMWLYKQYQYAVKEKERYRIKDMKYREKKRQEAALLPPKPKKKPGPKGPRKPKIPPSESLIIQTPDADNSA